MQDIASIWILICAMFVFVMQIGFTALESGSTRNRNHINIAMKNAIDFAIASIVFWLVGYGLIFGDSYQHLFGTGSFLPDFRQWTASDTNQFIFQMMFCGTATTIISGAISERIGLKAYALIAMVMAALIYPVTAHWIWNSGDVSGWLVQLNFIDFAGATVVHSIGAWVSLALLIIIGPRLKRFAEDGKVKTMEGNNYALSIIGALFLWAGWLGFNGGSVTDFNSNISLIVINTIMAGSSGVCTCMLIAWSLKGKTHILTLINGLLAALVAITACCHIASPLSAIVIGAVAAVLMVLVSDLLLILKIDDVVGVVPVHGAGGVWGTLSVAFFHDQLVVDHGFFYQLGIQSLGVVTSIFWGFGMSFLIFKAINHFYTLRVSQEAERKGLNLSEHGAETDLLSLVAQMDLHKREGNFDVRVELDRFSEIYEVAEQYNSVLDKILEKEKINRTNHDRVNELNDQLQRSVLKLQKFNKAAVNREDRIIELKKEINELKESLGEKKSYQIRSSS